jgi:integrase
MKMLYRLFRHHDIYYAENTQTGKQQSLRTRDEAEARKLLHAKNEAAVNPLMNLALGKTYLAAHDPKLVTRTWAEVMADLTTHGRDSSQARSSREMRSKPYNLIRNKKLIETTAEDFKAVLAAGGASTNNYLRRLHNLALGLGWLPWPILPPKLWPKVRPKNKRGITREEHKKIVTAELNVERRLYYEMLWELGAAQTDTAKLTTENIDWNTRTVVYKRQKLDGSSEPACMSIGARMEEILKQLPSKGPLFPNWSQATASDRSSEFSRRCRNVGVSGISLHSYRYAWAERAREAGYPERWAQAALGHNSRAVHQAYAKGARVVCPALEDYEKKIIVLPDQIAKRVA